MPLRDYQSTAIDRVLALLPRNTVLVAPTGSGKTYMAAELVRRHGGRVLWLAHRRELIRQAADQLRDLGLDVGLILSGEPERSSASVQVASVQTLARRATPPHDLVVADECHHLYRIDTAAPIVGLTATPFRLDGRGLGSMFSELVVAACADELCAAGILHKPKVYSHAGPDLSRVRIRGGDYDLGQLGGACQSLVADIVPTWQCHRPGRTVVFTVNVQHSIDVMNQFLAAGIATAHIDGSTPKLTRDLILSNLACGTLQVVCNCMVLTEGWDLPALECAVVARPTASLNLHLQMIGRIMRACPDKAGALVLDHAGNHHRLGSVTQRVAYSLDGRAVSEPLGLKRCRACGLLVEPKERACPDCGYVWTTEAAAPVAVSAGILTEFDDATYEYRREVYTMYLDQATAGGYKPGWAAYRYYERFGHWPETAVKLGVDTRKPTADDKQRVYDHFAEIAAQKGFKTGWVSHQYRALLGVWPRGINRRDPDTIAAAERMWVNHGGSS